MNTITMITFMIYDLLNSGHISMMLQIRGMNFRRIFCIHLQFNTQNNIISTIIKKKIIKLIIVTYCVRRKGVCIVIIQIYYISNKAK